MESTDSVSRGVFLFCNKASKINKSSLDIFEKIFNQQLWYITYKRNWHHIQKELKDLHYQMYDKLLSQVVNYVRLCHKEVRAGTVPTAALLTGVNQPDHTCQFTALVDRIRQEITPHVATVTSQDGSTLKFFVENAVWQLIEGHEDVIQELDGDFSGRKLKKYQCTMKLLQKWYNSLYNNSTPDSKNQKRTPLVIIVPDFESFNPNVLQDFIMVTSSYTSSVPIVLVFGVATTIAVLHQSLPYHVTSKMLIRVFQSVPSNVLVNHVIDSVFLTPSFPMMLAGNVLEFLTDVYLFYDFSVSGLVDGIKYCMMEHYYGNPTKSLCCERDRIAESVYNLSPDDLEAIRHLYSFRGYVESKESSDQIRLLEVNDFLQESLVRELHGFHDYLHSFYACLRLLHTFVHKLPHTPLGKTLRELYIKCTKSHITETPEFKECMALLRFSSKEQLLETIAAGVASLGSVKGSPSRALRASSLENVDHERLKDELGEKYVQFVKLQLQLFAKQLESASAETVVLAYKRETSEEERMPKNRYRLKEKLLESTRTERIQSEYDLVRSRFVSCLEEVCTRKAPERGSKARKLLESTRTERIQSEYDLVRSRFVSCLEEVCVWALRVPTGRAFHELSVFADLPPVRRRLVGAPRAAQHTALNNPHHYLQCNCCNLPSPDCLKGSLPDISVAFKLHRECGKHINLFDWLQAFAGVMRPDDDAEQDYLDPTLQARFSQAVSALHFLGFIKPSKRKTDHVVRLTW